MTDSNPAPDGPVGRLVAGKYEVLRLIGRGGMGSVWEGRHATLGTRVAIKFIDAEYADSKEAQSRFVTEARAAAALESKHAIQIYDHGLAEGRPYMVMELLTGEPLDRRIDRLGTLPLVETARFLGQVARALTRAHQAGIIHRDLKPENIFIVRSQDDDDEIAKVLDFGIAKFKAAPGEQGVSTSTKTGAVLGTPYYMAPEQARGLRTIDTRADLWSVGVIAYKCTTGVLPFEGVSVGDLLVKICTADPPRPSKLVPQLPPEFDAWFARSLGREPEQRYQTAAEQAEELARAAGLPVKRATAAGGSAATSVAHVVGPPSLPAAALTSAPLETSAVPVKSSRGVLAVALTALLGGSIGVLAVVKGMPAPAQPSMAQSAALAVPAPSPPPSETLAPPSPPVPSGAAPAAPPAAGPTPAPSPGSGPTSAAPRPRAPSAAGKPAAARPPPKPAPGPADPGY